MFMFIVLEGIDNSGKTTLAKSLQEKIPNSIVTRSPLSKDIRQYLLFNEINTTAKTGHFFADVYNTFKTIIEPALREGKIVICDRFYLSTLAYGLAEEKEQSKLYGFYKAYGFKTPDLTLFLDCDIVEKENPDIIEAKGEEYFKRVLNYYNEASLITRDKLFHLGKDKSKYLKKALKLININ